MRTLLEVMQLRKQYKNFEMKDVNFTVGQGEIHGLVGNNGAGKTTLLKCIMQMIQYSGQVRFQGSALNGKNVDFKRHIGYVGDFDLAYRGIPLQDIYGFTKKIYGAHWDDEKFKHLAKGLFALDMGKTVEQLSMGMKKKFWLALALSHSPKLLLLDEPTTGIDPESRDEILDFIIALAKEENTAAIFSTHIIEDLEKAANRVMVIKNGNIVFNDTKNKYFAERGMNHAG